MSEPKDNKTARQLDPIEKLQQLVEQLNPEERERMAKLGVVIPNGDVGAALRGDYKYGIRCTYCNDIALYLVGDQWIGANGEKLDLPPAIPHWEIAWTQDLPAHEIDRNDPKCQHCGQGVGLEPNGCFRRNNGRIVEINRWRSSRDKAYDRKFLNQFAREVATGGAGQIEVAANYNMPDRKVSAIIESQRGPGALKEIETIASVTGVKDALNRGFKP